MIKRPIKAPTEPIPDELLSRLPFPFVGSPKLDGMRCEVLPDGPRTSLMKPIQNRFIYSELSKPEFFGLDGEIIVGDPTSPDAFHNTSGAVRRFDGEPDFKLYVFDQFMIPGAYTNRWIENMHKYEAISSRIVVLPQQLLYSPDDVLNFERQMLDQGYEGAMIRSLTSPYKQGRCTFNEMNIFKRKPFVDCEARILSLYEAMENCNPLFYDERGLAKRSKNQENMIPKGTLGGFWLVGPHWNVSFSAAAGKGFTDEMKQKLWNKRDSLVNVLVTIKYQKHGSRERPRMPSVIKIHCDWDR